MLAYWRRSLAGCSLLPLSLQQPRKEDTHARGLLTVRNSGTRRITITRSSWAIEVGFRLSLRVTPYACAQSRRHKKSPETCTLMR